MKTGNKKSILKAGLLALACVSIFAFTGKKGGGDHFEILLNGKQVLFQYVHNSKSVQTLQLASTSPNDKLDIFYSHCGVTGTGRSITIKDAENKELKTWRFANASGKKTGMSCRLNELLGLQKNKDGKLKLYYSSKEMPEGRMLAAISAGDSRAASLKK
jgi:hypothetical protein